MPGVGSFSFFAYFSQLFSEGGGGRPNLYVKYKLFLRNTRIPVHGPPQKITFDRIYKQIVPIPGDDTLINRNTGDIHLRFRLYRPKLYVSWKMNSFEKLSGKWARVCIVRPGANPINQPRGRGRYERRLKVERIRARKASPPPPPARYPRDDDW